MTTKKLTSVLMCSPDHYRVEYVINPWMKPGSVDQKLAKQQWQALVDTLKSLHIEVEVIPQHKNWPDMVFATDQGFIVDTTVILSNLCYDERKGETALYKKWFTDHGFTTTSLGSTCFEGGECLPMGEKVFLGTGFRASEKAVPKLKKITGRKIIPLQLIKADFYHLDTCFLPLDNETAFYYPPAFSPASQQQLQTLIPNLLAFTEAEANAFAANSFVIGKKILIAGPNQGFAQRLQNLGFEPIELDISEFIKAGGGIHCLILPLRYD